MPLKLSNLRSDFTLTLGHLNLALNNLAQILRVKGLTASSDVLPQTNKPSSFTWTWDSLVNFRGKQKVTQRKILFKVFSKFQGSFEKTNFVRSQKINRNETEKQVKHQRIFFPGIYSLPIRTLFLENDTKSLHCWKGLTSFWTLSKSINYVNEHYYSSCEKKPGKKNQARTGIEPMTSSISVQCSTN